MIMLAWSPQAHADGDNLATDREEVGIDGSVPMSCRLGDPGSGPGMIELGALADGEGRLRGDLAAPTRNLVESFCNGPSTLSVTATRLSADGARGPTNGFARAIDFTVSVSGWTDAPAIFATATSGTQAAAAQYQPRPRQSDIQIDFSDFRTTGGNSLRLIAASRYEAAVIVLLSPTP